MGSDMTLRLIHIFLLVLWLGVDFGVFYTSFVLRRKDISSETRLEVSKIMLFLDLGPRLAMILMIPVALWLAYSIGLGLTDLNPRSAEVLFWGVILASLLWIVGTIWREHGSLNPTDGYTRFLRIFNPLDWILRIAAMGFFVISGILSLTGGSLWITNTIAWKAILFGFTFACAMWIDLAIKDFGPALMDIISNGETAARLDRLNRSLRWAYPPVFLLWAAIVAIVVIVKVGV
ncbi:MAG: hypothetical protein HY314_14390 [Acidobacteria bacterium]|nr:hypothetical protein [Acidobacteriota bacterium]